MIVRKTRYTKNTRFSKNRSFIRRNDHHRSSLNKNNNSSRTRLRGNPSQVLSKYLVLAKNALSSGDTIQAEYYFQYADHYSRIMAENGIQINNDKIQENNEENSEESNEESNEEKNEEKSMISDEVNNEENSEKDNSLESVGFLSDPNSK